MRKRFQNGRVVKSSDGRYWVGKWLEGGHDRSKVLGKVTKMTKAKAREEMARIVKPINERAAEAVLPNVTVKVFVETVYLPFYRRKWKRSTAMTNEDRVQHHIVAEFGDRELRTLTRDELQRFLESKASLSFSTNAPGRDWLFPSEKTNKPISRDNAMRRYIRPKLEEAGFGWVDFHVMRRTHSSLMRDLGIDPKVVADQQGHTLDVNLNVYTESSLESRLEAVETLGSALVN